MADPDDLQRVVRAAAASYDYERDPRWVDFWSNNVFVSPSEASRPEVIEHFKRKFYQRFIDPALIVEPLTLSNSSPSSRDSSGSGTSAVPAQPRSNNAGSRSSSNTTRTTVPPNSSSNHLQFNRETIHFSVNAWIFILATLGTFPLAPKILANKAYRLSFLGTACYSLYSLCTLHGVPRTWSLVAFQVWFQSIVATTQFMGFVYCVVFVSFQVNFKFALLPLLCRSLEYNAKFLRRYFSRSSLYRRYLERTCVWADANANTLILLSSSAEICVGFLLILSLFSWQRNVMQTFIYWQLLKLMYNAPATSVHHRKVWTVIGRNANPYIQRYAPLLNTPVSILQRWWFR